MAGFQVLQELKEPPLVATTVEAAVYVKVYAPPKVTDPFVCVFTVAAAWQLPLTHPDALCFGCACVLMVAVVMPWHSVQLLVPPPSTVFQVYGESRRRTLPVVVALVDPAGPERAAVGRHRARGGRCVREARRETHRAVAVRRGRRGRVAVVADRPGARAGRQVRAVRVARQRRRSRAVALRAAVRPAPEHRVPGVPQDRRRALPVVVAEVDPAGPERAAVGRNGARHRPAST